MNTFALFSSCRFDAETTDESEKENENEAITSFVTALAQWDKDELEERLGQRVQVSLFFLPRVAVEALSTAPTLFTN